LGSGNTPTFLALALSGQSLTGSQATSLIDASATWNTTGIPTLIKANVVDTASSSSSLLMDLQVGGASRFNVTKAGRLSLGSSLAVSGGASFGDRCSFASVLISQGGASPNTGTYGVHIFGDYPLAFSAGGGAWDIGIFRDAAQTLAQRNSTNAQTFRIYNTFTDASNYERGKLEWSSNVFRIGTEKAGTGSARALELQTDGTTRLTIASTGATTATGRLTALDFLTTSDGRGFQVWQSPSGPAAINFGMSVPGTSNGSDMWFSTTSNLNTWIGRLSISSSTGTATFYGDVQIDDAKNIVMNTTTGTKIGTATTQKLAFWNATPVVQPTAVADATDAASVITQLNALLTRMRNLGLIAT
jgi:hypothetical protein